jgi:hypothetical protein
MAEGQQQEKHFTMGDVTYRVFIRRDGTAFRATWSCSHCQERAPFEPVADSEQEAVDAARIGIQVHHNLVH